MKRISAIIPVLLSVVLFSASCEESKMTDDHENWQERNSDYIDKIASSTFITDIQNAAPEQMFRLLSFKLDPKGSSSWGNGMYVYCKVISKVQVPSLHSTQTASGLTTASGSSPQTIILKDR